MDVKVKTQPFSLPPLPYDEGALEPTISKRTMGFHYGKHHANYVKTLNDLVAGTPFAEQKLEDVIKATYMDAGKAKPRTLLPAAAWLRICLRVIGARSNRRAINSGDKATSATRKGIKMRNRIPLCCPDSTPEASLARCPLISESAWPRSIPFLSS